MKEIPVLFSTPMVQAILEGRKTQTRRVVKTSGNGWDAQQMEFRQCISWTAEQLKDKSPSTRRNLLGTHGFFKDPECEPLLGTKCPYGQSGDLLWVRESFKFIDDKETRVDFKTQYTYPEYHKWKPSIHMPKAAARIWLQVEEIKVERLQSISEEDAIAEGIEKYGPFGEFKGSVHPAGGLMRHRAYGKASRAFQDLWEDAFKEKSWKANPWVWVIKFKVLSTVGKPVFASSRGNLLVNPYVPADSANTNI